MNASLPGLGLCREISTTLSVKVGRGTPIKLLVLQGTCRVSFSGVHFSGAEVSQPSELVPERTTWALSSPAHRAGEVGVGTPRESRPRVHTVGGGAGWETVPCSGRPGLPAPGSGTWDWPGAGLGGAPGILSPFCVGVEQAWTTCVSGVSGAAKGTFHPWGLRGPRTSWEA